MFGSNPQNTDPQEALNKAKKTVNKGMMGGLTKMFMGKAFVDQTNQALDSAQSAIDESKLTQELMTTGQDAKAKVVALADTGRMVNYNPVLKLTLEINSGGADAYTVEAEKTVSKIMIPRVGDTLMLKVSPTDKNQFAVVGIMPSTAQ